MLPRPSRVNGQFQANALDCLPVVNIKPFGVCAITRAPCMPVMPFWTQVHAGALKVGGAPPLLESSVCQCGLGGRIGITVLPVPGAPPVGPEGVGGLAALQEQQRQQDAAAHELANHAKEQAGKLALLGLACAIGGLFFPPLELVAVVALEASEAYLVAGIAIDVAVAIDHPTQDNWVTVGGDVVAVALGYVVGKVVVGRLMTALARRFGPAAGEGVAAETVPMAEGLVIKSPQTQFGKLRMAYEYYKQAGWSKDRIIDHMQGIDRSRPVELVEFPAGKEAGQLQSNPAWKGNYFAEPGTSATNLGINPKGELPGGVVVNKIETLYSTTEKTVVLRSSAAPVLDTWSVPSSPFQTEGGSPQYFHFNKDIFQLKK